MTKHRSTWRIAVLLVLTAGASSALTYWLAERDDQRARRLNREINFTPIGPAWFKTVQDLCKATQHPQQELQHLGRGWVSELRVVCASTLIERNAKELVPGLIDMFESGRMGEDHTAAFAVMDMTQLPGDEVKRELRPTIPYLISSIRKEEGDQSAVEALGMLGATEAVPALVDVLCRGEGQSATYKKILSDYAATALFQIGRLDDEESVRKLTSLSHSADRRSRIHARAVLRKAGRDVADVVRRENTPAVWQEVTVSGEEIRLGTEVGALAATDQLVFAALPKAGEVAAIDVKSKVVRSRFNVEQGAMPEELLAVGDRLLVSQGLASNVLVFDLQTHECVARLPLGNTGRFAVSLSGREVYFASNKDRQLCVIDATSLDYEPRSFPAGSGWCSAAAVSPHDNLLYLAMAPLMQVMLSSLKVVVYDPTKRQYVAEIDIDEFGFREHGPTTASGGNIRSLAFSPDGKCLFAGTSQSPAGIYIIDRESNKVVSNIAFSVKDSAHGAMGPISLAVSGDRLLAVNRSNKELVVLSSGPRWDAWSVPVQDACGVVVIAESVFIAAGDRIVCYELNEIAQRAHSQ